MNELELRNFYFTLQKEILTRQTENDGDERGVVSAGSKEEIFTSIVLDLLAGAGETENTYYVYDEKKLGTKNQHKINGYAISENYETLDLFITVYKAEPHIATLSKSEINTAAIRISNFFKKAYFKEYYHDIEKSSRVFDIAHTIGASDELRSNMVRVNAFILTDCIYREDPPVTITINDINMYFRVIDLRYLLEIDEKSHLPIEIDFAQDGYQIPCISSPVLNGVFESYLAIIPGEALATIYEKFGSRLLEQNVRSFLQFTGKINKGIRLTLKEEPHMFLAFNNGITATVSELEIIHESKTNRTFLKSVKDFQIVNGGQTTASIFHTWKKDRIKVEDVYVSMKLTRISERQSFSTIVSRIAEYANTQNKVSVVDLSSNRPFHIQLEKLSRSIITPHIIGKRQTKWFYERSRGQYRNARLKEGTNARKRKEFDLLYPKNQVLGKEEFAKYLNAYSEFEKGKKNLVGPHLVVRGNQKNYISFLNHNIPEVEKGTEIGEIIDNIYFEDSIAKAILFKSAEKIYGVKPNAIGDLRYITVPYTISLLTYLTKNSLDLYKVWSNQAISQDLSEKLLVLMRVVENHIKSNAPGSLYGEWAKKLECWEKLKMYADEYLLQFELAKDDVAPRASKRRKKYSIQEIDNAYFAEISKRILGIKPELWHKLYITFKDGDIITQEDKDAIRRVGISLAEGRLPSSRDIIFADKAFDVLKYKVELSEIVEEL